MSAFISSNSKKAFISSTSKDLGKYREAAYEVCNRLSIVPIGMEQFESMGVGATEGSKSKINEADVYVGIVANRYRYIEDGYAKSVTELEFDHAEMRGLDRLCFVADEGAELPKYPEDQVKQVKLAAFKDRIGKLIRNTFKNDWDFKLKLYDSVLKWLFRQRGTGPLARHVFEPLFVYYACFGGRADVLARVKTFIDSPEPGYLVITGPAGYGKTALAVRLVEHVLASIRPPAPSPGVVAEKLRDLESRAQLLETVLGEHPSHVDFIEEERAGHYVASLKDTLIALSPDPAAKGMIDRLLAMVEVNPYPRYRDNALVALGVATLAVPDRAWSDARMQSIVETGLDREGVTFTFDLPAQLVAEADRRGLASGSLLRGYLAQAAGTFDRWGTRLRGMSAQAAADFVQGRSPEAFTKLESAGSFDQGFAGYMSAHLLAIASRWCELGASERIGQLRLVEKSRSHAAQVRDPGFAKERGELVDRFEQWLGTPVPEWSEVSALLCVTPESDNRRAYKDLVSARWSAERKWENWGHLLVAALADATALDFVLGRLAARVVRRHHEGVHDFPDAALDEAMSLCSEHLATSRPWEVGTPTYG